MLKVFAKDLLELFEKPFLAFWLIAAPLAFLLVANNISVPPSPVATLVGASSLDRVDPKISTVRNLLGEISDINVLRAEWDGWDPSTALTRHRARMAVAWDGEWHVYVRPEGSSDRGRLESLAYQIGISIRHGKPWQLTVRDIVADVEAEESLIDEAAATAYTVIDLGSPAVERNGKLISAIIALTIAFLPFMIACASMVREWEHGTLQTLLVAPAVSWWGLVGGKICLALFATIVVFVFMTIVSFAYFGIPARLDFFFMLLFQLPAMATSVFLGMAASSILRAQFSAYFVSVLYVFCLMFLTGMMFPIPESAELIQMVSESLPLTHSLAAMNQWLLHGVPAYLHSDDFYVLLILCAVSFGIMMASTAFARRKV